MNPPCFTSTPFRERNELSGGTLGRTIATFWHGRTKAPSLAHRHRTRADVVDERVIAVPDLKAVCTVYGLSARQEMQCSGSMQVRRCEAEYKLRVRVRCVRPASDGCRRMELDIAIVGATTTWMTIRPGATGGTRWTRRARGTGQQRDRSRRMVQDREDGEVQYVVREFSRCCLAWRLSRSWEATQAVRKRPSLESLHPTCQTSEATMTTHVWKAPIYISWDWMDGHPDMSMIYKKGAVRAVRLLMCPSFRGKHNADIAERVRVD